MPGKTKRKYQGELMRLNKALKRPVGRILQILPYNYSLGTIERLFKKYYYYDWLHIREMKALYDRKDKKLLRYGKKIRYEAKDPINYLLTFPQVRNKLKNKKKHQMNFCEETQKILIKKIESERLPKLEKIKEKREVAKEKAQQVEPLFLDALIGLYERKRTSQKDKVYIFKELEKYYCTKTIIFFQKINDTEINHQLREMAFYHLQSLGHYVKLRKRNSIRIPTKNKKRRKFLKEEYPKLRYDISQIPEELEYRIVNHREQKIKSYDYFISHSSSDATFVQNTIKRLNEEGKNIYCDWINDTNYLKRKLVGEATKKVIEKRLDQSKRLLLIKSRKSTLSDWVKYELNYFRELEKPIFEIDLIGENLNVVEVNNIKNQWFYDENYKTIKLY